MGDNDDGDGGWGDIVSGLAVLALICLAVWVVW